VGIKIWGRLSWFDLNVVRSVMAQRIDWRIPFDRNAYDPDTVSLMSRVLRAAAAEFLYPSFAAKEKHQTVLAARIMAAVASGERDFEALKRAAFANADREFPTRTALK
jgi:hypothetical protein